MIGRGNFSISLSSPVLILVTDREAGDRPWKPPLLLPASIKTTSVTDREAGDRPWKQIKSVSPTIFNQSYRQRGR